VTLDAAPIADAVSSLLRFRSVTVPVVSLYLAVPENLRAAKSKLHELVKRVRELAKDGNRPNVERESLRADSERILELEELLPALAGRTLAFFRCSHDEFEEAVVVQGRLLDRVILDDTPYLRPLLAVLDESHRYCVVVVDREHSRLFDFYLGRLEARGREDGRALRKPNYAGHAGLDEHRVRNKAEELARKHYRDTAEAVERTMREHGDELLIVGGHEDTVAAFLPFLPGGLRDRLAGTFVIDPSTVTPARVRDEAQRLVDHFERREEQRLVAEALDSVGAGGLGAAGLEWCVVAADEQAIQLLLVDDDATAPGRVCDNCGWLGLVDDPCPVCSSPTRATSDIIDEIAAAVIDAGGQIEHVDADTPLKDLLLAAQLRFPVPRPGHA
jgi:peptide chain release factor subunit 1